MKTMKSALILAAVTVAVVSVSCTKEDTPSVNQETKSSTITLSIEQPTDELATKTQLGDNLEDSYPINWTNDDTHTDAIAVGTTGGSDVVKYTLIGGGGTTEGTFTGTAVSGEVKAFYPYADVVSASENVYNVNIPTEQTYTSATSFGEDAMPMYAVASSTEKLSSMKPLMSVLKITLSGSCTVKRIRISNESEKLSGSATVTYTDKSATLAFSATDTNDYVDLVCPSGVKLSSGGVTFHIVVPATAGSVPTKYTVRVFTDESKVMTKKFTPTNVFTAAKIKNLTKVLNVIPGDKVQYIEGSYIGDAAEIGGIVWAPVNCGYDAANYKYGKLYQWGRHDGCGYNVIWNDLSSQKVSAEAVIQTTVTGPIAADKENASEFYMSKSSTNDWLSVQYDYRWSSETGNKTEYDPCPDGWRVPTSSELSTLSTRWMTGFTFDEGDGTIKGYWFCNDDDNTIRIFLPAAGSRSNYTGTCRNRNESGGSGYWSSSASGISCSYLIIGSGSAYLGTGSRSMAYSVRCVKE